MVNWSDNSDATIYALIFSNRNHLTIEPSNYFKFLLLLLILNLNPTVPAKNMVSEDVFRNSTRFPQLRQAGRVIK